MDAYRAWADIDLDAFASNLGQIRARVAEHTAIMLVVKADAYGHGAVAISHCALRHGVSALGVGTSAEALELRKSGVRAPILVLGTIVDEEATACLVHEIQLALHSADRCQMLEDLAARLGLVARVHLKIDTGMGRLGVLAERALPLLEQIRASRHMRLCGVMTHVSSPLGAQDEFTALQMTRFKEVVDEARRRNLLSGWVHAANSACVFTGLDPTFDAVRPGIAAYGVLPDGLPGASELEPVMSLRSQVVFLKDLGSNSPVGYAGTWKAERATRIATLPVGYNDGVPWRLGNKGEVLVRGERAPIVGRVSMDYTTVDVGHIPGVSVGDRVTLFGRDGEQQITLEEVAKNVGTIPYEITCSVGRRVERIYRGGDGVLRPQPRVTGERQAAGADVAPTNLARA
ncbi:MAG TPA: alanine racemase [Planctomycetota bacterium]|nr:alanine racemase [Planctomycetota bacterium]